jgi:beta-N-acetylhexosaminidase
MSRKVLEDLLRGELGFTGLVVTDGIEMAAIADTFGIAEGTVLALAAGVDAVCVGGGLRDECDYLMLRDALMDAVRDGRLPEERLHDAATRVRELGAWAAAQRATVEGTHAAGGAVPTGAPAPVAAARPASCSEADDAQAIGLAAATRAITVSGAPLVPLTGPAAVLEFVPLANNAAGSAVPWGLSPVLSELPAGSSATRFVEPGAATGFAGDDDSDVVVALAATRPGPVAVPYTPEAVAAAVSAAEGQPLIVVVRDVHRHAWMASALAAATAVRPDAIVVEMGIAYGLGERPGGATLIATRGAALVSGLAVARLLTKGSV